MTVTRKFAINGVVVRTSKTHDYTHSVVGENGKVWACSGSYELALKAKSKMISDDAGWNLNYYIRLSEGRYKHKGERQYAEEFKGDFRAYCLERIEYFRGVVDRMQASLTIVPLERVA